MQDTIDSIKAQDYANIEYIIIDGDSKDGTLDIIRRNEAHISQWISEPDKGIYDAMNKGLDKTNGEIIGLLNADDLYYPDTISKVVTAFSGSDTELVYGNLTKLNEIEGEPFERTERPDLSRIEEIMTIFHPSTFVLKSVYDELGKFDTRFRVAADYEFILRCYLKEKKFSYLDEPLAKFRMTGISNANCDSYEEAYQILKNYDLPTQTNMAKLITKCKRKKLLRGVAKSVPGGKSLVKKRQKRNWS